MRVIVFDRIVDELNRIGAGLRADGFDVVTVSDVAEGLQLARHYCPDAAIVDVAISGKKLDPIRALADLLPTSPVIAICGSEDTAAASDALKRGADQVLYRPVTILQLSNTLRAAIERTQLKNQLSVLSRVQQDQEERHDRSDRALTDKIHKSDELLDGLNDLAQELSSIREESELLTRVPKAISRALTCRSAALLLIKDGSIQPDGVYADGDSNWLRSLLSSWPTVGKGELLPVIGEAYERDCTRLVRNVVTLHQWPDDIIRALKDHAVLATPIRSRKVPIGVLVETIKRDSRAVDDADQARFEMCATMVSMALDSVRAYRALLDRVADRTDSLRRQRVRAQALMDASSSVILLVDQNDKVVIANNRVKEYFGVAVERVLQSSLDDFLALISTCYEEPAELRRVVAELQENPDSTLPEEFDPAVVYSRQALVVSPRKRWVTVFSMPVSTPENEDLGRVWIFADVSRERNFHEQIRVLVEASPIPAIISKVSDGRILYVNQHLADLVGVPIKDLIGRLTPDFYFDPKDRQEVLRRVAQDGQVRDAEFRIKTADGKVVWMIFSVVTAQLNNEAVIIGNLFDITARRTAEDQLRKERNFVSTVLDTAAALIVVLDPEGKIIRFNCACERLTGYTFAEVKGKTVWELFLPPEEKKDVVGAFTKLATGDFPVTLENHWLTRSGEKRLINWSATSITNENKEVEFVIGIGIDFTERRQAEEKLRLYRQIFDNTNDAIAILDPRGNPIEVNPAYLKLSGYDPQEGDKFAPAQIVAGDGFRRVFDAVEQRGFFRGELQAERKDGSKIDIDLSAFAIRDNDGAIQYRVGFSRDITQRKEQEKALAARLAYEEGLAKCSQHFLTEADMDTAIERVLEELLHTSDCDRVYIFENFIDDEERLAMRQTHEVVREGISAEINNPELQHIVYGDHFRSWQIGMEKHEAIRHHTDELTGPERDIMEAQDIKSILVLPIYLGDKWSGFIGFDSCRVKREWTDYDIRVLRTVAEMLGVYLQQKRYEEALTISEERFRSLVENANDVIYSTNSAGRFTYISPKFTDILGYEVSEFLNRSPQEIMHPDDVAETSRRVQDATTTGSRQSGMEFRMRHKNGSFRWFESNFSIVGDERTGEMIGVAHDITEIKKVMSELSEAYRDLRDTQAKLLQSEKMASLGSLVAGIAHEINTPIGAVASMHDTLVRAVGRLKSQLDELDSRDGVSLDKLRSTLKVVEDANRVIENGTERVTTIVRRLRSFARLDEAEVKTVDIHEGIEDTLTLIHHEIKNTIEIVRDYGKIPLISCFPGQLNQVFLNILVNARQAIKDKGRVTISTRLLDKERVEISFADNGVGMTQETMRRIFDPGFTTKGVGVGTGLGLSICYQIIQDHRGEISVESSPGEGTTFRIVLPIDLERILEEDAAAKAGEHNRNRREN